MAKNSKNLSSTMLHIYALVAIPRKPRYNPPMSLSSMILKASTLINISTTSSRSSARNSITSKRKMLSMRIRRNHMVATKLITFLKNSMKSTSKKQAKPDNKKKQSRPKRSHHQKHLK